MQSKYSIAFMGTSLTWLWYYEPPLIAMLQAATGKVVRPFGYGRNGEWSDTGVSIIPQVLADRPDFALFEYSMNDCAHITQAAAQSNTNSIINSLKGILPAGRIFPMIMNPTTDSARTTLSAYYQDYRTIAASQGTGLIDCTSAWTAYGYGGAIHPTQAEAQAVTTQVIYSALLPLLT